MENNFTKQGRNKKGMTDKDIKEYLGITDNIDKNYVYNIIQEAKAVEETYCNQNVDYCLKEDYYTYMLDVNTTIINETKNLIIYK